MAVLFMIVVQMPSAFMDACQPVLMGISLDRLCYKGNYQTVFLKGL